VAKQKFPNIGVPFVYSVRKPVVVSLSWTLGTLGT
jgi:hypothetical protein